MPANPERMRPTEASFAPIQREAMNIINKEFVVVTQEMLQAKAKTQDQGESEHLGEVLKAARGFLGNDAVDQQYVKAGKLKIHPQGGFKSEAA